MQQYPVEKQFWEQGQTERAVEMFERDVTRLKSDLAQNKGNPLSNSEKKKIGVGLDRQLRRIKQIGDVEARLTKFRKKTDVMSRRELRWETHYSQRLGKNLRLAGKPRPDEKCQAHAIVAGADPSAGEMRGMLAVMGMRVDDPVNGVWLPAHEDDIPHWALPNAVAHSWLNHAGYHNWLSQDIFAALTSESDDSKSHLVAAKLTAVAKLLQQLGNKVPKKAIRTKAETARLRGQR